MAIATLTRIASHPGVPQEVTGYDERRLRHIAREIAMDMLEVQEILEKNAVSPAEWERIQENPQFQAILVREMETWNSSLNTPERVRIKALSVVEDALLSAAEVINSPTEAATGRAKMIEVIAKIANVGEKGPAAGEGGKVMIQINMGSDKALTHEVTPEVTISLPEDADG